MVAYGKKIVVGFSLSLKANPAIKGKVLRIYPFDDKPNIMVRWNHGAIKTYNLNELRV